MGNLWNIARVLVYGLIATVALGLVGSIESIKEFGSWPAFLTIVGVCFLLEVLLQGLFVHYDIGWEHVLLAFGYGVAYLGVNSLAGQLVTNWFPLAIEVAFAILLTDTIIVALYKNVQRQEFFAAPQPHLVH